MIRVVLEIVRGLAIVLLVVFALAMGWETVCGVAGLEGFDVSRFLPEP